jgi:hypothetical protein
MTWCCILCVPCSYRTVARWLQVQHVREAAIDAANMAKLADAPKLQAERIMATVRR